MRPQSRVASSGAGSAPTWSSANSLSPAPENLKTTRTEYEEHRAVCHGLDGSGRNRFEAEICPPVAKLTGGVQKLSDAEI